MSDSLFTEIMRMAGLPEAAIASFHFHLDRLRAGETGTLPEAEIEELAGLPDLEELGDSSSSDAGVLNRVAVIKLNGGMGTSMGLEGAKSLLPVRDGLTFLDLIARQILAFREKTGTRIPLLLMDSFRTTKDSERALAHSPELALEHLPLSFLQHRVPKVLETSRTPAVQQGQDSEHGWCPPGHGDLFTALHTSGVLRKLLAAGIEFAFVSNADNLGAVLDPIFLDHMESEGLDFLIEAADRTPADRKGGHLCRLLDGRLTLRESAQCPPEDESAFQDVQRHRFFNTNNVWVRLSVLQSQLDANGGFLPLPTIVNRKHLDPRDPSSPKVLQLETAMGAALSLFPRAAAVRVPRTRFSPVKTTNDLLGVRSDAFDLTFDGRIVLAPEREGPPVIQLDDRFYAMIEDFDARFPHGPPSLRRCNSLHVVGDVTFGEGIVVEGEVTFRGGGEPSRVPDGAVLRSEHRA
ncbi:MAG: UTP--glucose-1-phosphate uridylyltransferase [Thermoanaerobaculales bacterium]